MMAFNFQNPLYLMRTCSDCPKVVSLLSSSTNKVVAATAQGQPGQLQATESSPSFGTRTLQSWPLLFSYVPFFKKKCEDKWSFVNWENPVQEL